MALNCEAVADRIAAATPICSSPTVRATARNCAWVTCAPFWPGICGRLAALLDDPAQLASAYPTIARWNFSRDFLARIPEQLMVVRAPGIGWSDWGTPEAIERTLAATGSRPSRQLPLRATA